MRFLREERVEYFTKIMKNISRLVTYAWHVFTSVLDRRGTCSREYHVMLGPTWYHHVNDIIHGPTWYVLMWLPRRTWLEVVSSCNKWRGKILTLPRRAWPVLDVEGGDVKCSFWRSALWFPILTLIISLRVMYHSRWNRRGIIMFTATQLIKVIPNIAVVSFLMAVNNRC